MSDQPFPVPLRSQMTQEASVGLWVLSGDRTGRLRGRSSSDALGSESLTLKTIQKKMESLAIPSKNGQEIKTVQEEEMQMTRG